MTQAHVIPSAPVSLPVGPANIHPWETAGLGKAPFRWVRVEHRVGPLRFPNADGTETQIGAPGQPMGCCAYCRQGIAECHVIRSADGREFVVGCDCVTRVYDAGSPVLTDVERASRKLRNARARKRSAAKSLDSRAKLTELLADPAVRRRLSALPGRRGDATALDDVEWLAPRCGHAGRVRLLGRIAGLLAGAAISA